MTRTALVALAAVVAIPSMASAQVDSVATLPNAVGKASVVLGEGGSCTSPTIIYDTTHLSTQGAELAPTANGAATNLADLVVVGGTDRFICSVTVEMFTLAATTPFNLTMNMWTACSTNGVGNTPCGNGPGTLIPNSTVTVSNITPPALGTIFAVTIPVVPPINISGEADNTISVALNPSRNDVFWRINETPTVGAIPAGEPATSFVERCGSAAANNGCQRNFGVNNNFAMTIRAQSTPVTLIDAKVE